LGQLAVPPRLPPPFQPFALHSMPAISNLPDHRARKFPAICSASRSRNRAEEDHCGPGGLRSSCGHESFLFLLQFSIPAGKGLYNRRARAGQLKLASIRDDRSMKCR